MDALRLIELSDEYYINRTINTDSNTKKVEYKIQSKQDSVACFINMDEKIDYYVTDVDNSESQYAEIEMGALMELKEFAELIIKFNNRGELT